MATRSTTASGMLLALALTLTLTLTALQMQLASVEALPITSRPIEGNAQLLAWEEWQRLTPDQRTLEKEKKVTAKSIFTLPFRHCPPDHQRYGDRCIPQINIDPTDLIKQELLIELSPGGSAPSVNLDYDYSDSDGDEDSDELFINVPLMQKGQLLPPLQPNGAAEDQALPSEDAPLKFNIFENKYPMTLDTAAKSTATTATTTTTVTTTETTTAATATATATTTAATVQQSSNRIATQLDDLLADSSVALPSTTTLSISLPPSSSNIDDFGSIEAIVVPAGLPVNEKASIQLVTKADAPSTATAAAAATSTTTAMLNADADEKQQQQQQHNEKELQMDEARVQPSEDDGEEALAQLLKVDTLLPATAYGSSVDLLPPFSHRRVAPLLSADLDDADESAATDMAPTADATPTTATATATAAATTSATTAKGELDAQGENRVMLKKSKVQPVQLSSTVATTTPTPTTATATATTIATPTTIAESSSATTTTTTTAAAEVEATATATTTSDTAAVTTTTTVAAAAAAAADEGDVAAIHQDANGNAKDDDRFYYQHSDSTTSSTTATSSSSSSSNTVADAVDLDELNYMAASDNLMTNTIGGQGDSEKAAGEMNFEQELSIINELVKGKWRLSQLRQQQQLLNSSSSSTTTAATTTSVESSEVTSSTPAASENTTFWSKLMPMLSQSSTEATTAATTDETAETIPATATATTTAQSSVADTSIATATTAATTTAATTTAAAATTSHLSINTNRSNRNSKIIRIDSIVESSTTTTTTTTTTTPAPTATPATPTVSSSSSNSSNAAAYTPFWWLPNFGVRLDRQVDENGEDRSLLLRFFRPFRAGNTAEDATRITTLPSRR